MGVGGWGKRELEVRKEGSFLITPHSFPHSALSTLHSALNSHSEHRYAEASYGTRNSALSSHSAHRYAEAKATALSTQHSFPHSELGTRNFALTQHSALSTQHSPKCRTKSDDKSTPTRLLLRKNSPFGGLGG
uniref:Uncharacterized protein n=1 Tax=Desertifilum tharense IPPAS B-1220 TaxID=1781255 RepID=A0ACD5GWV5_9CYAN